MNRSTILGAAAVLLVTAVSALAAAPSCQITFRIGTATKLSTASVFAIYQNAPGEFEGTGPNVSCTWLNGTVGAAADGDQTRTLTLSAIGTPNAISGPKDYVKCTWLPTSRFPSAGDFNLNTQSGFSTTFQQVDAKITISGIQCTGTVSTTTTTTTLPSQLCGDYDGNGKRQTSDALSVLRAAVGQKSCALCVCDLDGNGSKSASDALIALRIAVGLSLPTHCPAC